MFRKHGKHFIEYDKLHKRLRKLKAGKLRTGTYDKEVQFALPYNGGPQQIKEIPPHLQTSGR